MKPRTWAYLNTPLPAFLAVMLPICGLMVFLICMPQRAWIKVSACVVLGGSVYATLRGYVRRIRMDDEGITFHQLGSRMRLGWNEIRRIDRYIPSGAVNGPNYVYITTGEQPPKGVWEIDSRTFQLQDRVGLMEALQAALDAHR